MNTDLADAGKKLNIYVCRCNEVTEDDVLSAIDDGARTLQGIKVRTESMMGLCQGRTCRKVIERMLSKYTDISKSIASVRPPVRAILIRQVVEDDDCENGSVGPKT